MEREILQGLVVCQRCHSAYTVKQCEKFNYYRCISDCNSKHISIDTLETVVWEEVKHLLKDPNGILEEYKRRFSEPIDSDTQKKDFSSQIISSLDNTDWLTKRNIIRTLVKRIEINLQDVNVVFRVKELQESSEHNGEKDQNYW